MSATNDPKPCPWCESEAGLVKMEFECDEIPFWAFWKVSCNDCHCPGANIHMWYRTKSEAIEAWNTRAKKEIDMSDCNVEHGRCVVIAYQFKNGGTSSHFIDFDTDEEYERFDFDRWFLDRMEHEGGMFPINGYERVSIDTIVRIRSEPFYKEES